LLVNLIIVIVVIIVMDSKGVSEVVGTLMAVLITFALAAVAFNFITAATVKPENIHLTKIFLKDISYGEVKFTYHGGTNFGQIVQVRFLINGEEYVNLSSEPPVGAIWVFKDGEQPKGPGALPKTLHLNPGKNDDHLIIVGKFSDGYESVIVDTFV